MSQERSLTLQVQFLVIPQDRGCWVKAPAEYGRHARVRACMNQMHPLLELMAGSLATLIDATPTMRMIGGLQAISMMCLLLSSRDRLRFQAGTHLRVGTCLRLKTLQIEATVGPEAPDSPVHRLIHGILRIQPKWAADIVQPKFNAQWYLRS